MSLDLIWIIDTSSLVAIKEQCSPSEARAAFALMAAPLAKGNCCGHRRSRASSRDTLVNPTSPPSGS